MLEPWQFPLLFATGLVAGFVDSIAGGGGLITVPVLLNLGLGPKEALGTNKLQASFGSGSATWHYAEAKTVPLRDCVRGFCFSLVGGLLGSLAVERLARSFLLHAIPFMLIAVAVFVLVKPRLGEQDLHPRMARGWFDFGFGLVIGFYDGFLGPGTGTFWTLAYMVGLGFNMTKATGYTKVMNFASNLSSLALFLCAGRVYFAAGLVMGVGQLLGARVGSRMVIAKGTRFIRPIFLTMVFVLTLKLIYDNYWKPK